MVKHEKSPPPEIKEEQTPVPQIIQKKNKPIKLLIFLIVAIIIIDAISLFVYFKPQLHYPNSTSQGEKVNGCTDGTPYNECSKNKPYFCYNGELLEKAFTCGCPEGYVPDFQSCKKI